MFGLGRRKRAERRLNSLLMNIDAPAKHHVKNDVVPFAGLATGDTVVAFKAATLNTLAPPSQHATPGERGADVDAA